MKNNQLLQRQWFITSKSTHISSEYDLGLEIGSGTYGKVFICQHKSSHLIRAVKLVNKDRVKNYETFINELNILRDLDHPNIVTIIETFETDQVCYMVLEYCSGGELFEKLCKLRRFTEKEAAKVLKSLLSAVMYCHNHGVCHRDLKPENCLFLNSNEDSDIKIIDFGLSANITEADILHDVIGTPYYIAPEMLSGNYSKVVDCWSLGVILYMLLSGTPPFNGKTNEEILMNVYSGSFTFRPKAFKNVSNGAKDLIARLLTKDPLYRITAQQAYMHPWIQELEPRVESIIPDSILMSLKNFSRSSQLKKASLIYIASKIASDEVGKMRSIFKHADRDGDGEISRVEFMDIVRVNSKVNSMDLEVMCSYLDVNKNGVIDYTEFIAGCMIRDSFTQDEWIRLSFEYFDTSKTGYITADSLKDALSGGDLMVGISKSEIEAIIQQADLNKDEKIDFSEFSQLMKSCSLASNLDGKL